MAAAALGGQSLSKGPLARFVSAQRDAERSGHASAVPPHTPLRNHHPAPPALHPPKPLLQLPPTHTLFAGFPVSSEAARKRFYVYSNWLYQAGVFISRSSGMLWQVGAAAAAASRTRMLCRCTPPVRLLAC